MIAHRKIAVLALALGIVPAPAFAGPVVGTNCEIGKAIGSASVVYWDLNGNGLWNGTAGGDKVVAINVASGAGTMIVGDWNGDGIADVGKQNGTIYHIDLNGNGVWNGNAGGDRSSNFAAFAGPGTPVVGDWNNTGADKIGTYVDSLRAFYLDVNGNGVWNGPPSDRTVVLAAFAGSGTPIVGDWNGDGQTDTGRYVGTAFFLDLNGNGTWDGVAGGDSAQNFAASFGPGVPVIGDWNGDGSDQIGVYLPGTSQFLLDLNGNRVWNGNAGGDLLVSFAAFAGAGDPLVCDWSGDAKTNTGRVVGTNYFIDKNGNNLWNGNAGGDRQSNFAIGGVGQGVGGVISAP
jgi:hypothetical protein